MGSDKELILALCPAHRRFIADPVGLLRGDFPLGKGLAELVAQRPLLRRPARFRLILPLYQHKFSVGGFRGAEVGGHRPQLLRVQAVVKAVFQALNGRPLGGLFVGLDVGRSRNISPQLRNVVLIAKKCRVSACVFRQLCYNHNIERIYVG